MAHHAYVLEGARDAVLAQARSEASRLLGEGTDLQVFTFEQLGIEQARTLRQLAYQDSTEGTRVIIVYTARIFHEAQNALLKIFEEPPAGTTLILGVPSFGQLLPTLRSRLVPLHEEASGPASESHTSLFSMPTEEREKFIAKLIERSKADNDKAKQGARGEATALISATISAAYAALEKETEPEARKKLLDYLEDLTAFLPVTHERSAPLKLIFEHLQLVIPK